MTPARLDTEPFRVRPATSVDLAERDPAATVGFTGDKAAGRAQTAQLNDRLETLQELLYAEGRHKLLIVLQAMDTGGKDGTIRHVLDGTNPQGVKVTSFKKPTDAELAHDFLWRVEPHTPADGEIAVFNRSHYEDVLVVRVHDLVAPAVWEQRYDHLVAFEQRLTQEGVTIRKFFLHISKEEQKARLQARLDDPDKHWKFSLGDLEERKRWDDYTAAYEAALSRTSTEDAPWYVVPADRKWFRNLVISQVLVDTLENLDMEFPTAAEDLSGVEIV